MDKSNFDFFSERFCITNEEDDQWERYPDSDEPYEIIGPRIKETPLRGNPHEEEILDRTP